MERLIRRGEPPGHPAGTPITPPKIKITAVFLYRSRVTIDPLKQTSEESPDQSSINPNKTEQPAPGLLMTMIESMLVIRSSKIR